MYRLSLRSLKPSFAREIACYPSQSLAMFHWVIICTSQLRFAQSTMWNGAPNMVSYFQHVPLLNVGSKLYVSPILMMWHKFNAMVSILYSHFMLCLDYGQIITCSLISITWTSSMQHFHVWHCIWHEISPNGISISWFDMQNNNSYISWNHFIMETRFENYRFRKTLWWFCTCVNFILACS